MTTNALQEAWFANAPGRKVDDDGDGSYDCADVPKDYIQSIYRELDHPGGWKTVWPDAGDAKDMINNVNTDYLQVILNDPNDATQIPIRGDIVVFAGNANNQYGHIAAVAGADQNGMDTLGEDTNLQEPITALRLGYNNTYTGPVSGWLRPIFYNDPFFDDPESGPQMATNQDNFNQVVAQVNDLHTWLQPGVAGQAVAGDIYSQIVDLGSAVAAVKTDVDKIPTTQNTVTLTDAQIQTLAADIAAKIPAGLTKDDIVAAIKGQWDK